MAYDPSTDLGYVRLLISDTDDTAEEFSDDEITAALGRTLGSPLRAAATLLRALAGNEAKVLKRIKLQGLETDGPSVAKELRLLAQSFDDQADAADDRVDEASAPVVIEVAAGTFGRRARLNNEIARRRG